MIDYKKLRETLKNPKVKAINKQQIERMLKEVEEKKINIPTPVKKLAEMVLKRDNNDLK